MSFTWREVLRQFSNGVIILSLSALFFLYAPFFWTYFPSSLPKADPAISGITLDIPKIGAQAPVVVGVDPFDPRKYHQALTYGVAQAAGTSLPGQPGTVFIFAHSSDLPWRLTRYNSIFLRLGELNDGDVIKINAYGQEYDYRVFDRKVVWPSEISYMYQKKDQLVLQTCTPIGTSLQRLLIFARPDQPPA